jgi:FMN phosphatase YigB (HAD superfamily)
MDAAGLGWQFGPSDLYDDALPALAALREAGYRLAVMANQPATVSTFMATLPVDHCATSEGWAVSKPDPDFFERVIAELGLPAESIAYVGDRIDNDVIPAKAAGMTAIHLRRGPWGVIQAEWPEAAQADARIESLLELLGVAERLWPESVVVGSVGVGVNRPGFNARSVVPRAAARRGSESNGSTQLRPRLGSGSPGLRRAGCG